MDLAISTGAQGLMWAILSLGVFLSFRILDVPDMTCEGSFPLGGAIAATMVVAGVSPWLAIVAAVIGGMVAGAVTGILYTKLKIPAILAGILTVFHQSAYYGQGECIPAPHRYDFPTGFPVSGLWKFRCGSGSIWWIDSCTGAVGILVFRHRNGILPACHRRQSEHGSRPRDQH